MQLYGVNYPTRMTFVYRKNLTKVGQVCKESIRVHRLMVNVNHSSEEWHGWKRIPRHHDVRTAVSLRRDTRVDRRTLRNILNGAKP